MIIWKVRSGSISRYNTCYNTRYNVIKNVGGGQGFFQNSLTPKIVWIVLFLFNTIYLCISLLTTSIPVVNSDVCNPECIFQIYLPPSRIARVSLCCVGAIVVVVVVSVSIHGSICALIIIRAWALSCRFTSRHV